MSVHQSKQSQIDTELSRMTNEYRGKKVEITDKNSDLAGEVGEIETFDIINNELIIKVKVQNTIIDIDNHNHLKVI